MTEQNNNIAFLDSGIGGLSVLQAFVNKFNWKPSPPAIPPTPEGGVITLERKRNSDLLYFADLKNMPYGSRCLEELREILIHNLYYLESQEIQDVMIACNTGSVLIDNYIRETFPYMKLWTLLDGLLHTLNNTETFDKLQNIIIFATPATCQTGVYHQLIQKYYPELNITSIPCPELVSHIESNLDNLEISATQELIQKYLTENNIKNNKQIDGYIFGCSHYVFCKNAFDSLLPNAQSIDPANMLADYITTEQELQNNTYNIIPHSSDDNTELLINKAQSLGLEYIK